MAKNNTLLWIGGGLAAYFFLKSRQTQNVLAPGGTGAGPQNSLVTALNNLINPGQPATYPAQNTPVSVAIPSGAIIVNDAGPMSNQPGSITTPYVPVTAQIPLGAGGAAPPIDASGNPIVLAHSMDDGKLMMFQHMDYPGQGAGNYPGGNYPGGNYPGGNNFSNRNMNSNPYMNASIMGMLEMGGG